MIEAMLETPLETAHSENTAARIIDAAERLFIRDGIDATSLRAVTREAGVNVAAIHYYFGSRDELLRARAARYRSAGTGVSVSMHRRRDRQTVRSSYAARNPGRPRHGRNPVHARSDRRLSGSRTGCADFSAASSIKKNSMTIC